MADSGNHRIQVFGPDGSFAFKFGSLGAGGGQFESPTGVAFGPAGQIAVADSGNHRIQLFDGPGSRVT